MIQFYIPTDHETLLQYIVMMIVSLLLGFAIGFVNHKKHSLYLEETLAKIEFDLENCLSIHTRFQNDLVRDSQPEPLDLIDTEESSKIEKDDLLVLLGIQSKEQNLLNQLGIFTFRQLHVHHPIHLKQQLARWDESYQIRDVVIWQQQAGLAASKSWDALKELQAELQSTNKF